MNHDIHKEWTKEIPVTHEVALTISFDITIDVTADDEGHAEAIAELETLTRYKRILIDSMCNTPNEIYVETDLVTEYEKEDSKEA